MSAEAIHYVGKPNDSEVLTLARALNGMSPDATVDTTKSPQPSEWTRVYKSASGKEGRVFTTLYGAPEDLLNEGYRRMLVNGMFWAVGLEDAIVAKMPVDTVGPFKPNTFANGGHARGIKPSAYAGFESPIPAHNNTRRDVKRQPAGRSAGRSITQCTVSSRCRGSQAALMQPTSINTSCRCDRCGNQGGFEMQ